MTIKRNLLLICFSAFCITSNAIAISPHDEQTCIEGTDFDIKRVRQLVVEGREVQRYGDWQQQEIPVTEEELDQKWGKHWVAGRYFEDYWDEKKNHRRFADYVVEDVTHMTSGKYTGAHYTKIREWDAGVQKALKLFIGSKLKVSKNDVGGYITTNYVRDHNQRLAIKSLNYQYRAKTKKFEVSNEYFKILNPRAQKVIESNCQPKQTICLDKKDKVFLGKYPVKRQCWSEEITYNCKTEPQNGCQHLIDQGYHLYKSSCLSKQEDLCLKWKRYYIKAKAEDGERYTDDEDEFDSSKFGSGGSGSGFDGYDGSSGYRRQRIFDFPRRERSNGGNGMNSDGSDTSDTDGTVKDAKESHASSSNGKNSSFQKYQSIPTKGSSSSGSGGTGGGISGVAGNTQNGKDGEHDAVIAKSIAIDPDFLLQEGTYIPCSLTMHFVSEVAGRIQCLINQDVYGASGRVKLIERGTKAIGVYQSSTLGYGMARMHVIWTKLLTPDYKRVNLVDSQVIGRLGEAGIDGRVNSHFAQRFGGALMVSLIKDVVAGVSEKHSGGTRKNTININTFENTKDSTTSIVERMLDASVNIPPTMYKKQGDIIGIEVGKDIDFSKIYKIQTKKQGNHDKSKSK